MAASVPAVNPLRFTLKAGHGLRRTKRLRDRLFRVALVFFLAVAAFSAFARLGSAGVNDWDEARHGVNAYEMMRTGSAVVNLYRYAPDYWNLKPPLSFWAIMLDFRIFGTTVVALRFYSALAMFLTVAAVAWFLLKHSGRAACLTATALLSCENPLYFFHYGRNGDADALFGFLCTLCVLALFSVRKQPKWLWVSGFCFSLAFLDKSWHACILLAVAGFFLLGTRRLFHLGGKIWAGTLLSAFGPIAVWAAFRFHADGTRFFVHMVDRDLLARSSEPLEGHGGGVLYYFEEIFTANTLGLLAAAVLVCFIVLLIRKRLRWKTGAPETEAAFLYFLWIALPFALYTAARTKYSWYILPTVVPICMVLGIACGRFWRRARTRPAKAVSWLLAAVVAAVVVTNGYTTGYDILCTTVPPAQIFLRGPVAKLARGRTAYIVHTKDDSHWGQAEVYVGEAYADLRCQDGGLAGFVKNRNSVAVVDESAYTEGETPNTKVLARADGYLLLAHS